MGNWFKNNLVLISGILLPVLLVGGFFALSRAPRMLSDPPGYDFLLVGYHYDYQHPGDYYLAFDVRDGHLSGRALPIDENHANSNQQQARIFRYDVSENAFDEITYDLPDELESIENPVPLRLGEAGALTLDKRSTSPDGYQFEFAGYRGRGGILGEIFGMRRQYQGSYILKKDGAWFDLPEPAPDRYGSPYDLHFMGWVLDKGPAQ